jgi:hypothetical protein
MSFSRPAPENSHSPTDSTVRSTTPLPFVRLETQPEPAKRSILIAEGDLAARPIRELPALPIQYGSEVLAPTIVQVAVQPNGFPLSKGIVSTSGSRAADLSALQIAGSIRFAADPLRRETEALQWGNLVFQWATAATPSTNAPAAPPK